MNYNDVINQIIKENTIKEEIIPQVLEAIISNVKEFVEKNKLECLTIGVSGGLDSAFATYICQKKFTGIPLIGVSIPMSNTEDHKEKAKWVGENYCCVFEEFKEFDENVPLNNNIAGSIYVPYYETFFDRLEKTDRLLKDVGFKPDTFPKSVLKGNMKARIRMITLYDIARKGNGVVVSTDNLSEENMGFYTLHGDVGDFCPIQKIYKGLELLYIAKYVGIRDDIVIQKPSDGLMVTEDNTDEAQLGAPYPEVDAIMIMYSEDKYYDYFREFQTNETVQKIVNRYKGTFYKRTGPVNVERKDIGL